MAEWTDDHWACFKVIRDAVEALGIPRSSATLAARREVDRGDVPANWRTAACRAWWEPGPSLRVLKVSWE